MTRSKMPAIYTLLIVLFVYFVASPLLVIWSLNVVFPVLAIPYNFWTWFATVVLLSRFGTPRLNLTQNKE